MVPLWFTALREDLAALGATSGRRAPAVVVRLLQHPKPTASCPARLLRSPLIVFRPGRCPSEAPPRLAALREAHRQRAIFANEDSAAAVYVGSSGVTTAAAWQVDVRHDGRGLCHSRRRSGRRRSSPSGGRARLVESCPHLSRSDLSPQSKNQPPPPNLPMRAPTPRKNSHAAPHTSRFFCAPPRRR
jgi:hypothetical protein